MKIGIVILATNAYFVLGLRFIKRFIHHYKGGDNISFFFFSDTNPKPYLPDNIDVKFFEQRHKNWVDGTNSKFKNMILLENEDVDYLYYFDADTNVIKDFDGSWFIGDLVSGEHYGNKSWLKDGAGFDRNPKAMSYVPRDSPLPYTYRYGAFFGGTKENVIKMVKQLRDWQIADKSWGYEPPVNDESYINKYFHYNESKTIQCENFPFAVSDKGGLGQTRKVDLNIEKHKKSLLLNKNKLFNLVNNTLIYETDMVG